ncbi:hypothetical protein DRN74_02350 [Candidatus Micrarchaeota archaeon]|nr:MAG: hypothetical protein DRN74_02350 [Candidatus Micrarchaeota archaeon]
MLKCDAMLDSPYFKNLPQVLALIVLIFILLFVLVRFGFMSCSDIPNFCSVYYAITGPPSIAILYGDHGMGDPALLSKYIAEESHIFPVKMDISLVRDPSVLEQYEVVIVEKAKKIPTITLNALHQYVQKGGRLVWIGDAGTELGDEDYICEKVRFDYLPASTRSSEAAMICASIRPSKASEEKEATMAKILCMQGKCDDILDIENIDNATKSEWKKTCEDAKGFSSEPVCSSWQSYSPNKPEELGSGLCNHSFGEVVWMYIKERQKLIDELEEKGFTLCGGEEDENNFHVSGDSRIIACIEELENKLVGKEGKTDLIHNASGYRLGPAWFKDNAGRYCTYQFNYWRRGPSKTELGDIVPGIDFSQLVLGFDYISTYNPNEGLALQLQAVDANHPLTKGYESAVDYSKYFGHANVSLVTTARFASIPRSNTIMYLKASRKIPDENGKQIWPAIIVSNPSISINKRGLIVYYAFAPEEIIKRGYGLRLINNLIKFMLE